MHHAGARVTVELDWDALEPGIHVSLVEGDHPPGEPDVLVAWEKAAVYGVRFALDIAKAMPCAVHITELCGDLGCTNPTLVAAASACAVWEALEVEPPPGVRAILEQKVLESREHDRCWLGRFEA